MFENNFLLFSVVFHLQRFTTDMNNDLKKNSEWAGQRKMSFTFHRNQTKTKKSYHPLLIFYSIYVSQAISRKHMGTELEK